MRFIGGILRVAIGVGVGLFLWFLLTSLLKRFSVTSGVAGVAERYTQPH